MKQVILKLIHPYRGSNRVSRWLRKHIETAPVRQVIGLNLAGFSFVAAVIAPQMSDIASYLEVEKVTKETIVEIVPTDTRYQWPINRFGLSQQFSLSHPGVDLTDPVGVPIFPVSDGWVAWTNALTWGYGNHILVEHENGVKSLYAHLSKTDVRSGQTVTKTTKLGEVGATGWATGSHLHLEVYQNGIPINPLEILPDITK